MPDTVLCNSPTLFFSSYKSNWQILFITPKFVVESYPKWFCNLPKITQLV